MVAGTSMGVLVSDANATHAHSTDITPTPWKLPAPMTT